MLGNMYDTMYGPVERDGVSYFHSFILHGKGIKDSHGTREKKVTSYHVTSIGFDLA